MVRVSLSFMRAARFSEESSFDMEAFRPMTTCSGVREGVLAVQK